MVMNAYVQLGKLENPVKVFDEMQGMGMNPFVSCYIPLITAYIPLLTTAIKLKLTMEKNGINPNAVSYNTIIHGFCKEGKLHDAFKVFHEMKRVNVDPNTEKQRKLPYLVKELDKKNLVPNSSTFSALIKAQCARKNPDRGFQLDKSMVKSNLFPNEDTVKMLILSFLQTDDYDGAFGVFKRDVREAYWA
ncbi:unnamed protein product [Lactuca virosa]|uniref:Pentatricopeptide repeat-containing protein n=1 Tax=Lactuca virosa TaxID=75947 RepID=A0AAU9NE23_9ASTR|nr:unnamed protein product [Lactuca virosa]